MAGKFDPVVLFRLSMMAGIIAILATVTLGSVEASSAAKKKEKDQLTEIVFVCVNTEDGDMRAVESDEDCKKKEFAFGDQLSKGVQNGNEGCI